MLTPTEYYERKWFDDNESTLEHEEYLQGRDTLNRYAEYYAIYKQTYKLFKLERQYHYNKSETDCVCDGLITLRELHKALYPNGCIDYRGILQKLYYDMIYMMKNVKTTSIKEISNMQFLH